MKKVYGILAALMAIVISFSCNPSKKENVMYEKGTFGYDLKFLSEKDSLIVLKTNEDKAQVIVSAKYQGKVFTSTANGLEGNSLGFVNYDVLNSTTIDEHMNGYGGENRFWLGPEGGQYSVYFEKGKEQIYDNWHTPKPIDTETWDIVSSDSKQATLKKAMEVVNYQGNKLSLNVDRKITMIESTNIYSSLGLSGIEGINAVGYITDNKITNLNDFEWTKETGTICIWILDMFIPAPKALTVIPFNQGEEKELGTIATTDYFGEIPADRLKVKDGIMYLKTDGKFRSKLGMNGKRTKAIAGNYDPDSKRLTITTYDVEKEAIYLNQEWNPAKDPLVGDAMNAYNDGPLEDGSIMGPFLEVESVSPAAFLKPNQSLSHKHTVYHFIGEPDKLTVITEKLLGVSINEINNIF
jgi:hypothetical protein